MLGLSPWLSSLLLTIATTTASAAPLGLPEVPIPADNPQTEAKIKLGDKLFHDARFSGDGKVSCATCHDQGKGFTDNLPVSIGFRGLNGTRNAPTVINSAYMTSMFWDGREPDLEGQSKGPPINPVEGGLKNHAVLIDMVRDDAEYVQAFKEVFAVDKAGITIDHVAKAIASFERTVVSGNSPFDRYFYAGEQDAMTPEQIRGFDVFTAKGRCVSCHTIEQTQAIFTDNRFHNIGVGFKSIQGKEAATAAELVKKKRAGADLDETVLTETQYFRTGSLMS